MRRIIAAVLMLFTVGAMAAPTTTVRVAWAINALTVTGTLQATRLELEADLGNTYVPVQGVMNLASVDGSQQARIDVFGSASLARPGEITCTLSSGAGTFSLELGSDLNGVILFALPSGVVADFGDITYLGVVP